MSTVKKGGAKKSAPAKKVAGKKAVPAKRTPPKRSAAKKPVEREIPERTLTTGMQVAGQNTHFVTTQSVENKMDMLIDTLNKTGQLSQLTDSKPAIQPTIQESFKSSVHDIIVNHETAIAKNKIVDELANCGDVYYITEAEKNKMVKHVKKVQLDMAFECLLLCGLTFILGRVIGYAMGYQNGREDGYFSGHDDGVTAGQDFLKQDFILTPKTN